MSQEQCVEYGIVILLKGKCKDIVINLNAKYAELLHDHKNVANIPHVTLYHVSSKATNLQYIVEAVRISVSTHQEFDIKFTDPIYATTNRWIDWKVQRENDVLNKLHTNIVYAIYDLSCRALPRSQDVYDTMPADRQEQVRIYGVAGLLNLYNPHTTLFYEYPPHTDLEAAVAQAPERPDDIVYHVSGVAVGIVGYNGNITEILAEISLAGVDVPPQ